MKLFTLEQRRQLVRNGQHITQTGDDDLYPVVKVFTPDANCTWLLVSLEPDDEDIAYGLCDLGFGSPEIGSVRVSKLLTLRGRLGLPVERDLHFTASMPLSGYAAKASTDGGIKS